MQHHLETQLRDHLAAYVTDREPLQQFLEQLMDIAEDAEAIDDARLNELVATIKLYWAEFTNGDHTEAAFRALLRPLLETYYVPLRITDGGYGRRVDTSSTSQALTEVLSTQGSMDGNLALSAVAPSRTAIIISGSFTQLQRETLTIVDDAQRNTRQELVFK